MSTNPSHILIARNSRGHNPSASISGPTETHAAALGVFRMGVEGSPPGPWLLEEVSVDNEDPLLTSEFTTSDSEGGKPIEIQEEFTRNAKFPGTVKIIVEGTTFWAHKEVLYFASPFFEAALSGNWSETGRPPSMSSVITIAQPPSNPSEQPVPPLPTEITLAPVIPTDSDADPTSATEDEDEEEEDGERKGRKSEEARRASLAKLTRDGGGDASTSPPTPTTSSQLKKEKDKSRPPSTSRKSRKRRTRTGPDAVIVLNEEKASTFHDFLKYVYPHLECTITWNNVEGLMNISHKLCVPSLQRDCLTFLITHAAGRPIKAMRIAELFGEEELYRESSRFLLDNPGGWPEDELNTLGPETLLKLEKRRNWFLERLLKLGLTNIAKEYQCCPTCPDPPNCARLLEDKWKQAYHSVFRFGAPQPSMVFRYLRMLEGVSPPLSLTHLACQTSAKAFTATLFDRMFSLGLRGNPPDAPLVVPGPGGRMPAPAAVAGPRRHFLYCTLKSPQVRPTTSRRSRETT